MSDIENYSQTETNKGMIWKAQTKDMDFADISNLRKSAHSVDKISPDNPQISQIRADLLIGGKT